MFDLDGNDSYNGGNDNSNYNNNSYGNNNYNSGYNNNSYGNNNYNNGYNNNGYSNSNYNSGYNNNGYNNSNYNSSYNSTGLSSTTTRSSGGPSFLVVIFAIAAVLFLMVSIGTEIGTIKNCKATTKGSVIDVVQTKKRVRRKNHYSTKYEYKAKILYVVDNEEFILDVPQSSCRFTQGETDTVYYNKDNPSESYSDKYMDHKKTSAVCTLVLFVVVGFICIFKRKTTGRV